MKWISFLLLGCMLPTCFAEVLVQQNFEDPTFPPAGWSADNFFPQMYWSRVGDDFNHYAFCAGIVFIEAHMDAPTMVLNSGDIVSINFCYAMPLAPPQTGKVSLYEGSTVIWSMTITEEKSQDTYILPPLTESGTYFVRWIFPVGYGSAPYSLKIDNVVISRNISPTQIQPSSLGMIRSIYK